MLGGMKQIKSMNMLETKQNKYIYIILQKTILLTSYGRTKTWAVLLGKEGN